MCRTVAEMGTDQAHPSSKVSTTVCVSSGRSQRVALPHADQRVCAMTWLHASEPARDDSGAARTVEHEPGLDARRPALVVVVHRRALFRKRDVPDSRVGLHTRAGGRGAVEQHPIEIRPKHLIAKSAVRCLPRTCRADLSRRSASGAEGGRFRCADRPTPTTPCCHGRAESLHAPRRRAGRSRPAVCACSEESTPPVPARAATAGREW